MVDPRSLRELAAPFADGAAVADWRARAARIGALAGAAADAGDPVSYPFVARGLAEPDRPGFARAFHQVESVERLAMSAVAHAVCRLDPPAAIAGALATVFYDEARHLDALATLQGLEPCPTPWIAAKRAPFWRLLRDTGELLAFVWFQHCLSEAEGAIAGAEKLRQLAGAGEVATAAARQIFIEETRHAHTGYALLGQLDHGRPAAELERLLARYLEVEPLVDPALAKGKRQRASLQLAEHYIAHRDVAAIHAALDRLTQAALET